MAKKSEVNKTQAVREYLKANHKARNQEVVDALAKKGITISANYVGNIKATHNKRQRAVRKVVAKGGVGIPEVKAALAFLEDHREPCGGEASPGGGRDQGDSCRRKCGHTLPANRATFNPL